MDLIVQIQKLIREYGIEWFKRYYSCYRGIVYDNKDPEFLGRIRITCPKVYGKDSPEYWAWPRGMAAGKDWGFYAIPRIGDGVWVSFEAGDPRYPIWEYGWWASGETPSAAKVSENPNFLFQSPFGHRIEFDDKKKLIAISNKKGFKVILNEKGIFVGDGSKNLNTFFKDLFKLFEETKVSTANGPQPFINVASYTALKADIDKFLTDSQE